MEIYCTICAYILSGIKVKHRHKLVRVVFYVGYQEEQNGIKVEHPSCVSHVNMPVKSFFSDYPHVSEPFIYKASSLEQRHILVLYSFVYQSQWSPVLGWCLYKLVEHT